MKKLTTTLFLLYYSFSTILQAQQYDTTYYQDQFKQIRSILIDSLDASGALELLQELPAIQDTMLSDYRLLQGKKDKLVCECYFSKGEYDPAIQNCKKALENHREAIGELTAEVGKLYNLLGQIYGTKGLAKEAIEADEKAYHIFVELYGEQHPTTCIYKGSLAGKYIMDSQPDDLAQKGYKYLTEVLEVQLNEFGENNLYTAETIHYLGKYYHRKGQYYKALDFQKRALQINLTLGEQNSTSTYYIYRVIGILYSLINDHQAAEDYLKIALEGNKVSLGKDHIMLSIDYYTLAGICKTSNRFKQAAAYLNEGISVISKKYGAEHIGLAHMYEGMGQIFLEGGEYQKGIDINQKALRIWKSYYQEPLLNFTYSLNNIATGYYLLGEEHTAISYYKEALEVYSQTNSLKFPEVAEAYLGMAKAYTNLYELDQARNYFNLSLETLGFEKNGEHFTQVSSLPILLKVLTSYGNSLKEWSEKEESISLRDQSAQMYDLAFQALNQMQIEIQSPESQQFIQGEAIGRLFEPLIALDYEKSQGQGRGISPEKSFQVAERSKALSLLRSFNKSNAYQFDGDIQVLAEKEEEIRAAIKEREQYLSAEKAKANKADANTIKELNGQLNYYKKQFYANLETLERKYPNYYQLKHQVEVYGVSQVRKLLPNAQTAVLSYFVGDKNLYAFIISKEDYQVVQMPIDPNLSNWIAELREQMVDFSPNGDRSDETTRLQANRLSDLLYHLYNNTFAPIEAQLDLPEQLIIIPDGVLGYVPFEMLLREIPEDPTLFAQHAFLIKDYQISYTYSATLLGQIKARKKAKSKNTFLAFAPEFNKKGNPFEDNRLLTNRSDLGPLLYNVPEAKSLQQLMGGDVFIGEQATEEAFLKSAPDYRIIHLATHAKANDLVGDYAYLAFEEIPDSIENELLYNRELYQLNLQAEMVVLSACETGTGELQRGEGVISLARGFSYAGAKSIITTLWSVDDQKTKNLMEGFYGYIKAGQLKDAALRQAKLDFIDHYSHDAHPFYWAAFIPIGDMSPISFNEQSSSWKWGIGLLIFMLVSLFYFRQRKLQ